jgi:catechol 2,3-dioxygenase-like lactoylglutathione lyase family enzyme
MKLDGVMIWVAETVAFYEAAFGLEVAMMDDAKTYAQLSTGETTLAFAVRGRVGRGRNRVGGASAPGRRIAGCGAAGFRP